MNGAGHLEGRAPRRTRLLSGAAAGHLAGAAAGHLAGLLDLVLPQRCAACGGGEAVVCAACRDALRRLVPPLCSRCGAPTAWPVERCAECAGRRLPFLTARAALAYEGPARALVAGWKEQGLRRLETELAALVADVVPRPDVAVLTFVPAGRDRLLWRGRNPAEALARQLGRRWELPVRAYLERRGNRPRQRGLSRVDRRANVRGAFRATAPVHPAVALVDDVYTTGATVAAAASELRRGGARRVHVVTLARAVRR